VTSRSRVAICGVDIDAYSLDETVDLLITRAQSLEEPCFIVTPNADHIVRLQHDQELRQAYDAAFLVVPDGVSLLWAARFLRRHLKGRVNGTDLLKKLAAAAAARNLGILLLGGRPGAAERAARILLARHPNLRVVGVLRPPMGDELEESEMRAAVEIVNRAAPHLLFVGLGSPKQELWAWRQLPRLRVPVTVCVGGSLDVIAGFLKRAPSWMQRCGLEWLFRLAQEPRRLWRRYITSIPIFILLVLQQKLQSILHQATEVNIGG
jgi:N-acetylglucosaminyldiphosphoundecaprenol N-acetyl-beta-D-mannosaminyltransferase